MKKFLAALVLLLIILAGSGLHAAKISALAKRIQLRCDEALAASQQEDWAQTADLLEQIGQLWNADRFWVCVTIPTAEIEELDISLRQSLEYAKKEDVSGFTGEFTMFRMLLEHLPLCEGFDPAEIL